MYESPCSANGSVLKNPESTPKGCIAEHTSCTKPGNVNSAERAPPPTVGLPSSTNTDKPACCKRMAAARPFGPEPTTTAS